MIRVEELAVELAGRPVLRGVTLAVEPGEIVALLGPNGAGKSTLLRAIAGLVPARGRIRLGADGRSARLAFMPQESVVLRGLSVLEVVLLGRLERLGFVVGAEDLAAARRALAAVGLEDLAGRAAAELSGGQRQMVYLAQALAAEPEIVLLDEPLAALDLRHQLEVAALVRRLVAERGLACLVVLHDLNLAARMADRLALLHEGRLLAAGPPEAMLRPQHLEALYGVETTLLEGPDGAPVVLPLRPIGRTPWAERPAHGAAGLRG